MDGGSGAEVMAEAFRVCYRIYFERFSRFASTFCYEKLEIKGERGLRH